MELRLDVGQFTLRDMKVWREMTGREWTAMERFMPDPATGLPAEQPGDEELAALVFIVLRKSRPEISIDDVWDMPLTEFTEALSAGNALAGAEPAGEKATDSSGGSRSSARNSAVRRRTSGV